MKEQKTTKYSAFQWVMIIIIPIIVLLLIASLVTLAGMFITHRFGGFEFLSPGNIVIFMASFSTVLAIAGIIFSIFSRGKDDEDEDENIEQ